MISFATYESFCKAFKDESTITRDRALLLYYLRNWFNERLAADKSLEDYSNLDELTSLLPKSKIYKDSLSKIVDNSYSAFKFIAQHLREKIIRENKLVPIYKVREINSYGINWLSKRNGRTIREKLSGSSSMMAVQQRNSFDTGENRLFMAFAKRLLDTLELKSEYLPKDTISEDEKNFIEDIIQLLRHEDFAEIRRWENLPPNNTLLSDKHYSIIWRAWNDLQKLDELVMEDNEQLDDRILVYVSLNLLMHARKDFALAQQPVETDYEHFRFIPIKKWVTGTNKKGDMLGLNWMDVNENGSKCIKVFFKNKETVITVKDNVLSVHVDKKLIKQFLLKLSLIDKIVINLCKDLWNGSSEKCIYTNKLEPVVGKKVIVDVFAVRPDFILDDQKSNTLPFRVMRQCFNDVGSDKRDYDVNVAMSEGIYAENGNSVTSCYTLNSVLNNPKDIRAPRLLSLINGYLRVNKFTFLFPDSYNDFQLSNLRKAARIYYGKVEALPASIAGAFSFVQSATFKDNFNAGDAVIAANLVNDKCSLTLLESFYDQETEQIIPELKGVIWERHPSSEYPAIGLKEEHSVWENVEDALLRTGCQQTELFRQNYGIKGLAGEVDKLTLQTEDGVGFFIDKEICRLEKKVKCDITELIGNFIVKNKNFLNNKKLHIVLLADTLVYNGPTCCDYSIDYLQGAAYYESLAAKVPKPLWKDHLPDLAIKQFLGIFDLVKDKTIEPMVNNVIEIKINEHFTLPARRPQESAEYHFKLQMNDGNDSLQYEAVVKHPAFPLKRDVECYLRMSYNYGADDPYTLIFEPIDKINAGFTEARVEFKPIEEYAYNNLPVPDFPTVATWSELAAFPSKDGKYTSNLTKNVERYFSKLFVEGENVDFEKFVKYYDNGENYQRNAFLRPEDLPLAIYARGFYKGNHVLVKLSRKNCSDPRVFSEKLGIVNCSLKEPKHQLCHCSSLLWKINRNGDWYAIADVLVDNSIIQVFFYEDSFLDKNEFNTTVHLASFKVRLTKSGKYRAYDLVPGNVIIYEAQNAHIANDEIYYSNEMLLNSKHLFSFHSIFVDGRNIDDPYCPIDLRESVLRGVLKLVKIFPNLKDFAKVNAVKVLSLTASPGCPYFYTLAKTLIANYGPHNKINDEIGYALGDCSYNEQNELFRMICSMSKRRKVLNIISKAAWKSSSFVLNINPAEILGLFDEAVRILIKRKIKQSDQISLLEFVLAVFRLRSLNDENINRHLSLNNPELRNLYKRIEEMVDADTTIKRSRLQLSVKRSETWKDHKISDFLYACIVYITGDSGESEIKITGVSDSDGAEDDED